MNQCNTDTSDKYEHLRTQRKSINIYESDKYGRLRNQGKLLKIYKKKKATHGGGA